MGKKNKNYVYFVSNEHSDLVKIGVSSEPRDRLSQMQVGSPVPLNLVGVINCDPPLSAYSLEEVLHAKFAHLRLHGEWFKADEWLGHMLKSGVIVVDEVQHEIADGYELEDRGSDIQNSTESDDNANKIAELAPEQLRAITAQLTPKHRRAIAALSAGLSCADAATAAGVSNRTMSRWGADPAFREALAAAGRAQIDAVSWQIPPKLAEATDVIRLTMTDTTAPAHVRLMAAEIQLKAALVYLTRVGAAYHPPNIAERLDRIETLLSDGLQEIADCRPDELPAVTGRWIKWWREGLAQLKDGVTESLVLRTAGGLMNER